MTANMVSVESDLCLTSCLHPKYHCKLRQGWQLCKTVRCIYSILLKSIWESSMTLLLSKLNKHKMLQQKNRVNGSKIKVSQRSKPLKSLNLMPLQYRLWDFCFQAIYIAYGFFASDGILQSPRGESDTVPTFGPSGRHERLNCCA